MVASALLQQYSHTEAFGTIPSHKISVILVGAGFWLPAGKIRYPDNRLGISLAVSSEISYLKTARIPTVAWITCLPAGLVGSTYILETGPGEYPAARLKKSEQHAESFLSKGS